MYANEDAILTLYKKALKGICLDYVIRFHNTQTEMEKVIPIAFDLVKQLIENFHQDDHTILGRLVGLVCYVREDTGEIVKVHHPSYQFEVIEDTEDFFITHMLKIAERMEPYNRGGSNLLIERICEIHLHLTLPNK